MGTPLKHDHAAIKADLLDLARSGAGRPRQKDGVIGQLLSHYTCEGSSRYDREFTHKVESIRPDWFKKPKHAADENKADILILAISGAPRPTGRLGAMMSNYISTARMSYDGCFNDTLRNLRPDWFMTAREIRGTQIIQTALNGGARPTHLTQARYPNIDRIREIRPDWADPSFAPKKMVLDYASSGADIPHHEKQRKLYLILRRYTRRKEKYDPDFVRKLKSIRPDWLIRTG